MNIGDYFLRVVDALYETRLIAWDGCHKIYLALDEYEEELNPILMMVMLR